MGRVSVKMRCRERMSLMRWPESLDEIVVVRDGHLTIKLFKLDGGWYAQVESSLEGKIFEGRVTEMSGLLAGHPLVSTLMEGRATMKISMVDRKSFTLALRPAPQPTKQGARMRGSRLRGNDGFGERLFSKQIPMVDRRGAR